MDLQHRRPLQDIPKRLHPHRPRLVSSILPSNQNVSSPTCCRALLRRDRPALAFFFLPRKIAAKTSCDIFSPTTPPPTRHRAFEGLKIMAGPGEFTHRQAHFPFFSSNLAGRGRGLKTIFSMAARTVSSHRREVTPAIHHHYRFPRKWGRWGEREKKSWDNEISLAHIALEQPVMKSQSSSPEPKNK